MKSTTLKLATSAFAFVAALGATSSVQAVVPKVEGVGRPAITSCPITASTSARAFHSDKIVFMIGEGVLQPLAAADIVTLNRLPRLTELDIKIRDNPEAVADIKAKVLTFLGAANTASNRDLIKVTDVEYTAVLCPKVP